MAGRPIGKKDTILQDFADNVVRLSKINLGKTYTAKNSRGKSYKKRIDNTGNLRKSVNYKLETRDEDGRFSKGTLAFTMLDYGIEVDEGREPGSEVDISALVSWIKSKPLRLRDLKTGKYRTFKNSKQRNSAINGVAYLISRNIKNNGLAPTNFFTNPFKDNQGKAWEAMQALTADQTVDNISFKIDLINARNSTQKS
tara:strand:- start:428 stop:1021 length:594 start_codon:yes stop_codon:yes gene_type:complete